MVQNYSHRISRQTGKDSVEHKLWTILYFRNERNKIIVQENFSPRLEGIRNAWHVQCINSERNNSVNRQGMALFYGILCPFACNTN